MRQLRPYQEEGVERLRNAYRQGRRAPLYVLPTGGGKSAVFSYIASEALKRGSRSLILVHRQELLLQASENLDFFGVPHGIIAPGFQEKASEIQVASVQTIVRRLDRYRDAFDLIIVDEAHHATAESWAKTIKSNPKARLLGVTATPWRMGGQGLGLCSGGFFDELILGPSMKWLIENKYLAPYRLFIPPSDLHLDRVKISRGDFDLKELEAEVSRPKITGSAVDHYLKACKGKPAISFCVSIRHAELVAEQFRSVGIRAQMISGETPSLIRKDLIRSLGDGRLDVLTSADLIGEGVDIPVVTASILLRPTHSLTLHLQQVGRALRPGEGKTAIILDHVGNTLRHGLPDDDREWTLKSRPKRKKSLTSDDVRVKQCPECYCAHEPRPDCPQCGHVYEVKPINLKEVDGELKEVSAADLERIKRAKKIEVARAKTEDELRRIAKERGYSQGWVYYMMKSRSARSG